MSESPLSGLAKVAAEPPEESVAHEQESVPDVSDTGGLVPADDAQSDGSDEDNTGNAPTTSVTQRTTAD